MNRTIILFLLALAVLTLRLGSTPFLESSEARYAEISREMSLSNDWVTPRLMEIKHFHKPPLTYWVTALAFDLFGINDLSGRLFLVLAALGTLFFTFKLSELLFPKSASVALWSFLILLSSPLFLIQSRALTTDIYLTFFTTGAVYFHWKSHLQEASRGLAALTGLFLGLAFLTKGPIPFIFFLLPYFGYQLTSIQRFRISKSGFLTALLIFLLTVLPWFLLVIIRNPGLLRYFLVFQTVDRYASGVHHRGGPFYYFIGIMLVGMLFWFTAYFPAVIKQLKNWAATRRDSIRLLLLHYTLLPLIFFSFSGSKLPAYILPALPFFSLYLAERFVGADSRRFTGVRWFNFALALLFPLTLLSGAISSLPASLVSQKGLFFWLFIPALLMAVSANGNGLKKSAVGLTYAGYNFILFYIVLAILPHFEGETKNFKPMARIINTHWNEPARIAAYHLRLPSLEFYTGRRILQIRHDRELQFETAESLPQIKPWLSDDPDELAGILNSDSLNFAVISRRDWRCYIKGHPNLPAIVDTLHMNTRFLLLRN